MKRLLLRAKGKKQKYFMNKRNDNNSDSSLESLDEGDMNMDVVGKILNDKYVILRYLNRGTFCKVYLVLNILTNEYYALKIQNPEDNNELENEYKNLIYLQNNTTDLNNIGRVYDKFIIKLENREHNCILFELLGNSLDKVMEYYEFSLNEIKKIIKELLNSLKTLADNKIIHCDLKPDNILFGDLSNNMKEYIKEINVLGINLNYEMLLENNLPTDFYNLSKSKRKTVKRKIKNKILKLLVKDKINNIRDINNKYINMETEDIPMDFNMRLIDFGNAEKIDEEITETIYTRCYRPPENIINETYNTKSDIWFIGCLLYELLTDKVLFEINEYKNNKEERDKIHLEYMIKYLDKIPKELIFINDEYNSLFDMKGRLKNTNVKTEGLYNLLKNNIKVKVSDEDLIEINDFLTKVFKYNPDERYSSEDLLKHNFLL